MILDIRTIAIIFSLTAIILMGSFGVFIVVVANWMRWPISFTQLITVPSLFTKRKLMLFSTLNRH